jgi:hypothetical protein
MLKFNEQVSSMKEEGECFVVHICKDIRPRVTKFAVTTCDTEDFELGELPEDFSETSIYSNKEKAFANAFQKILEAENYHNEDGKGVNVRVIKEL